MKLPTKDLSRCHCASRACSHLVFVFIFLAYQVLTLSTTICFVQQVLHQPPPTSFSIQSAQITLKQPILLHSITGTHSMHLVLLQREHSYISVLQDSQKACPQPPSHTFISSLLCSCFFHICNLSMVHNYGSTLFRILHTSVNYLCTQNQNCSSRIPCIHCKYNSAIPIYYHLCLPNLHFLSPHIKCCNLSKYTEMR